MNTTQTQTDLADVAGRLRRDPSGLLSLGQAARLCPAPMSRRGYCSSAALLNWILRGKGGVRLEAIRGPGKGWFTTAEALDRFWGAITRGALGVVERAEAVPTPTAMERQAAAARAKLAGKGQ